ncbi:MAG: hypothetical protein IJY47_00250 [Clostridia bacterium]|nr:hypothetical protein [Clostridia bacterium]
MKNKCGGKRLSEACRRGTSQRILEQYIRSCHPSEDTEGAAPSRRNASVRGERFPNLAGFCRFAQITPEELERLAREYPEEVERLYATLEDEALNSSLPAAILSVYLKKRLGYEYEKLSDEPEPGTLQICFEHDVLHDGE